MARNKINAYVEINNFIEILQSIEEFPEEIRDKLSKNLRRNVIGIVEEKMKDKYMAFYHSDIRMIKITKKGLEKPEVKKEILLHELFHAATTFREYGGDVERMGFANKMNSANMGINEGATEYFAQRMYNKAYDKKVDASYKELVFVIEDLVNLYGENVILDAMVNGTDNLKELMKQDGKSFSKFNELLDDYFIYVYTGGKRPSEMRNDVRAKECFLQIGSFIEDLKKERISKGLLKSNPETEWQQDEICESEWKQALKLFEVKKKESMFEFLANKLREKIFPKKESILLNQTSFTNINVEPKSIEFHKQLKVDVCEVGNSKKSKESLDKKEELER